MLLHPMNLLLTVLLPDRFVILFRTTGPERVAHSSHMFWLETVDRSKGPNLATSCALYTIRRTK
jgi:hypothetical protein